jgi:hypothetical protein
MGENQGTAYDLGSYIIPYTKELLQLNLEKEVKLYSLQETEFDFGNWYNHYVAVNELPALTVGYDMGWQKRSSGH